MKEKPKHALKDSVFKNLFGDKKYLLQLYQALHPEDTTTTEADIEDVTINPVFMGAEYNDLGFSVGGRLIALVESQSTWSPNIIIRALLYLADTYNNFFKRTDQNLYISAKADIPAPELYVIYTGPKKDAPEYITLKEEFFKDRYCAIDVKIKVLSSKNDKSIIGQYIAFCRVYDEQREIYGRTRKAIEEAIKICLDKDILHDYLKEHGREVQTIMMILFDENYLSSSYEAELKRKYEAKLKLAERETAQRVERETAKKDARQFACKLLELGEMSEEKIAALTGLSVREVNEIKSEIEQGKK